MALAFYLLDGPLGVIVLAVSGGIYLAQLLMFLLAYSGVFGKFELIDELKNKAPPTRFWKIAERDPSGNITNLNEKIARGLPPYLQPLLIVSHEKTIHNAVPALGRIPLLGELITTMLEAPYILYSLAKWVINLCLSLFYEGVSGVIISVIFIAVNFFRLLKFKEMVDRCADAVLISLRIIERDFGQARFTREEFRLSWLGRPYGDPTFRYMSRFIHIPLRHLTDLEK